MSQFKGVPLPERIERIKKVFLTAMAKKDGEPISANDLMVEIGYQALSLVGVPKAAMNSLMEMEYVRYSPYSGYSLTSKGQRYYDTHFKTPTTPLPQNVSGRVSKALPDFFRHLAMVAPALEKDMEDSIRVVSTNANWVKMEYVQKDGYSHTQKKQEFYSKLLKKVYGENIGLEMMEVLLPEGNGLEPSMPSCSQTEEKQGSPAQPAVLGATAGLMFMVKQLFPHINEVKQLTIRNEEWEIEIYKRSKSRDELEEQLR